MVKAASIFILLIVVASCSSVTIQCLYKTYKWERLGSFRGCLGRIANPKSNPKSLDEISDEAVAPRDMLEDDWRKNLHDKVRFLSVGKSNLELLPKRIDFYFPNLEILQWYNGSLSAITADDLAPFPNIKHLYISGNKIVTLDADVLSNNLQLVDIYANNNLIDHVGKDLLRGLDGLKYVDFRNNPCIDVLATSTSQIEELNQQLPLNCPLPTKEPEQAQEQCCVRDTMNEEVDELKRLVQEQGEKIAALREENEAIKSSMLGFNERIAGIDVAISKLSPPESKPMAMDQQNVDPVESVGKSEGEPMQLVVDNVEAADESNFKPMQKVVDEVESVDESKGEPMDQQVVDEGKSADESKGSSEQESGPDPDRAQIDSVVEIRRAESTDKDH